MGRKYVDGPEITVTKKENNIVNVRYADGTEEFGLEPRRLFPVQDAEHYITLLDEDGEEHCIIRDIAAMQPESQKVLRNSLEEYYLVPHIRRIITFSEKYGTIRWTVETDRGVKSFDIRNRNHDIKTRKDGSIRVRDSDDNRYIIDDWRALDKKSKNALISDI